jgi:hypothetical protein
MNTKGFLLDHSIALLEYQYEKCPNIGLHNNNNNNNNISGGGSSSSKSPPLVGASRIVTAYCTWIQFTPTFHTKGLLSST